METLSTPSAEVKEDFMGFRIGDTAVLGLSELQRFQLLGLCTDPNAITWRISTIRTHTSFADQDPACTSSPAHQTGECTSSPSLLGMMDIPFLPLGRAFAFPSAPPLAPTPLQWTPKYQPEQRVYTGGSDINSQPRLWAAVV